MRISDWSSGVCSSDLLVEPPEERDLVVRPVPPVDPEVQQQQVHKQARPAAPPLRQPVEGMDRRPGRDGDNDQSRQSSDERRVGKSWVTTGNSRYSRYY